MTLKQTLMLHIANPIYDSVFNDDFLDGDEDLRRIVTRLLSAASDTQVRHNMNIEEEISMALENRDTEIMLYKQQLSQKEEQLATAIRMLKESGMDYAAISSALGIQSESITGQSDSRKQQ